LYQYIKTQPEMQQYLTAISSYQEEYGVFDN